MNGIQLVIAVVLELFQLEEEYRRAISFPAKLGEFFGLEAVESPDYLLRASGPTDAISWLMSVLPGQWEVLERGGVALLLKSTVVLVERELVDGRVGKTLHSYPGKDPDESESGKGLERFFQNMLRSRVRTFTVTTLIQQ